MSGPLSPVSARRVPTSALLVSAALGAVQALVFLAVVPVTSVLAAASPPAYALVAAVHTALPFLARVVTRVPGMATLAAFVSGVLTVAVSPIGLLGVVPLVLGGVVLDLVLPLRRVAEVRPGRVLLAGGVTGVVLFVVALPVFSPEHLVPPVLIGTLLGRVAGEVAVAGAVLAVRRLLRRAGVAR
ncbi:ECF transporter S component [Microbacterium sp. NPDC091676]|uniref:ECF transporter S component n=1 Tax=Microbacterium sp. NPDC091676 TaxID=3364212 RepID=UPI0037FEC409